MEKIKLEKRYENIKFENNSLREKDYLNNLMYAVNLEQKIIEYYESDNDKPLYIALTGGWGSGKTTVAKTATNEIKKKYGEDFKLFEFDAWKYEGDGFRRTFTNSILEQSGIKKNTKLYKSFYNRLYNDKNVEIESFSERFNISRYTNTEFKSLKSKIILIIFCIGIVALAYFFPTQTAIFTCIAMAFFNYFEGAKMFKANVSYAFDKLFSPEQFYNTVNEILNEVNIKNKLIFIDNIDRCNDEDFVDTVSSIKGFFNNSGKIVYLIPFDISQFNTAFKKEYQSYSEKVFDDTIDIKEKSTKNVIEFIDKLLKDHSTYKPLFTDDSIGIIANSNCKTPRQILNIVNNFITEYNLLMIKNTFKDEQIDEESLSYLMKYTILKINYKELFNRIHINRDLIEKLESFAIKNMAYEQVTKDFEFMNWLDLETYNFLLKTYAFTANQYSDFYDSQNDNSFAISKDLEEAILKRDFEYVINFLNDKKMDLSTLASYFKNSIIYDIKQNHWKTNIAPKFELVIELLYNGTFSIDEIEDNLKLLLKAGKFFPELIYSQLINFDKALPFISTYIDRYPKRYDFKEKLIGGLINKNFKFEPIDEKNIASKIFNEIELDINDLQQKEYFYNYIDDLINNDEFKTESFSDIFKSKNSLHIKQNQYELLLDKTESDDVNILNELLVSIKEIMLVQSNNDLFSNYITFINNMSANLKDINIFHTITSSLLELRNDENWVTNISNLNLIMSFEEEDTALYEKIYNILLLVENNSLKNILLNLNKINNKDLILKLICYAEETPEYVDKLCEQFILKLTGEQFETFIPYLVSLYENYSNYEEILNEILFSSKQEYLIEFYNKLSKPDDREILIKYVISQDLTFEQKIKYIDFYETEISRYNDLINNLQNISELSEVMSNTKQKAYFKNAINRVIEIIDSKANILDDEVNDLERIMSDDKITNSEKIVILLSIGITKTTIDNLFKIYNKTEKPNRKSIEFDTIVSFLIENGKDVKKGNKIIAKVDKEKIKS